MNIVFLYDNAFPVADASANRLLSIGKGLVENNCNVNVVCLRPSENPENVINIKISGILEGVNYIYPGNTTIWPVGKFNKLYIYLKSIIKSIIYLTELNRKTRLDAIVSYVYSFEKNLIFYLFCKVYGVKFAFFVDEYPNSVLFPHRYGKLYRLLEVNLMPTFFDTIIPMTHALVEYYKRLKKKSASILHVPMTVDFKRFEGVTEKVNEHDEYFLYAGYLGNNKDGVDIMLSAFSVVSRRYSYFKLYILGYTNNPEDFNRLNRYVKEENIEDKVVFTGKIHRDEIPKYFCGAKALLLARPNNIQAKGGFPTKLGEYLATGKPVVVTNAGDIPLYLKDGWNSYVALAGSIDSFASKLLELIHNPLKANEIGLNGKKLAYTEFNYKLQAERIIQLFSKLNNSSCVDLVQ